MDKPPLSSTTTFTTDASSSSEVFTYPPHYNFPPFFTPQPNPTARASQLLSWKTLILSYCQHHRLFSLSPTTAATTPLFYNKALNRRLAIDEIIAILDWMSSDEGGKRAEWIQSTSNSSSKLSKSTGGATGRKERAWLYWKTPDEWATSLERWVDETGQKGAVLTFWELTNGEQTRKQDWWGMETEMLARCLSVVVKRGKGQVFGEGDGLGVKFF
jgi:ESCRT-II complex subunit VPS25